jgi:hypothetical protein
MSSALVSEYAINERRFEYAAKCLDRLWAARLTAPPCVVEHLDKAIAAADGARAGYSWRDDELHAEAVAAGVWSDIVAARNAEAF